VGDKAGVWFRFRVRVREGVGLGLRTQPATPTFNPPPLLPTPHPTKEIAIR